MAVQPREPGPGRKPVPSRKPSLRVERQLQRDGHRVLAGMDEVGRGALAGPVSVGVVLIDESCRSAPTGVKDSKLLTPAARVAMVPRIRRWALAHAVGHASPAEIDEIGIIAALRLAGCRALASIDVQPDLVILDGNHDWLTAPDEVGLFAFAGDDAPRTPPVTTMVKADLKCSSVAAASVLAKVERDGLMMAAPRPPCVRVGRQQGVCRSGAPRGPRGLRGDPPAPPVVAAARCGRRRRG
jgi:ribonuclease HII